MKHSQFIFRLVEFLCRNEGTILINEFEVNGARHSKSELHGRGRLGAIELKFETSESIVVFQKGKPQYTDWINRVRFCDIQSIQATADFVRIHTEGDEYLLNYREWNYTDENGFGSTMPWETPEEHDARYKKVNAGFGLVPA